MKYKLSAAMWHRVVLMWLMLGIAALTVGVGVIGLGRMVQDNIRTELSSQQITFPAAEALSEEERRLPGLVEYAGQPMTTGNQAQAYAGYIGLHMAESATEAGYPGGTYATIGGVQRELRAAVTAATEAGDEAALAEAQEALTAVTNLRSSLLTGNNLRANLLSAYGWDNVANGMLVAGIVLLITSFAAFVLCMYEWLKGHLPPTQQ